MTSKRMASSIELDALSNLPDVLLIMIISCLSFKECLRTSLLSKRWRYLCRETRNISFEESEYVDRSVSDKRSKRISFVNYMCQWVSRYQGYCMETFEIKFSVPWGFAAEMESLIEFAVARKVKNLVLDFTDFYWSVTTDASRYYKVYVHLPASVYNSRTLESLKIYSCGFDPSKFTNSGSLRKLSIGWIELTGAESLILTSPTLKSLSFSYCWGVVINNIAGDIKEFVFENCEFSLYMACSFDLPNVEIFKYSGQVLAFDVKKMNKFKEVYLDFEAEGEYEEPNQRSKKEGTLLSGFLNSLRGASTLSVCSFLLQAIQECDDPSSLLRPMETQHLVLRTRMHVMEFKGIRLLLDNCPNLETLTFECIRRSLFSYAKSYCGVGPRSYWKKNLTYQNLPKTLKVVVVKNFSGCFGELNVLTVLIQSGRRRCPGRAHGPVLERVELYVSSDMAECQRMEAHDGAKMLQSISGDVQVLVHDPRRVAEL
ncbi:PREDICTED: putative F-box/LRR-repeat protein At1g56400 [Camelina sativa]|uniref:F-box/LRR-repeat protein At1g56400 n=1 Tax=Camelina sativa TaxID=90675 RepID=A0ABM1QIT2_CAMSA|nr:PREDICTED: putative F-box/LRR-repeat protein At1g56400 [Camelina sativa]